MPTARACDFCPPSYNGVLWSTLLRVLIDTDEALRESLDFTRGTIEFSHGDDTRLRRCHIASFQPLRISQRFIGYAVAKPTSMAICIINQ